jgi:hypothetical protein
MSGKIGTLEYIVSKVVQTWIAGRLHVGLLGLSAIVFRVILALAGKGVRKYLHEIVDM